MHLHMHAFTYLCIYAYRYACVYLYRCVIYIHIYILIYTYVYINIYTYEHTYVHTWSTCVHACRHLYVDSMHMHKHIYIYMYISARMQKQMWLGTITCWWVNWGFCSDRGILSRRHTSSANFSRRRGARRNHAVFYAAWAWCSLSFAFLSESVGSNWRQSHTSSKPPLPRGTYQWDNRAGGSSWFQSSLLTIWQFYQFCKLQ